VVAAINPAFGRKSVLDTFSGKTYRSQSEMVKKAFPSKGKFYMYQAYEDYPGRFIVNGVVQRGRGKLHWDVSTQGLTMVNCGKNLASKKTRLLSEVTCKNCLKGVSDKTLPAPVFDEVAALIATRTQWEETAIYDLGINGKALAPSYTATRLKYRLDLVSYCCFLCEYSNGNPGSAEPHNCIRCPLFQEQLDDFEKRGIIPNPQALCETHGGIWQDFKRHVQDEDPSDRYDIAMKAVAMCDARLKELLRRRLKAEEKHK